MMISEIQSNHCWHPGWPGGPSPNYSEQFSMCDTVIIFLSSFHHGVDKENEYSTAHIQYTVQYTVDSEIIFSNIIVDYQIKIIIFFCSPFLNFGKKEGKDYPPHKRRTAEPQAPSASNFPQYIDKISDTWLIPIGT